MNTKTTPLLTSLVVNVLLLGAAGFLLKQSQRKPDSPPPAVVHVTNTGPSAIEKPVAVSAPAAGTNTFDWRRVESDDYRQYIANLRAIGCPEKTIRDIIVADVNELFRERGRSAKSSTNRFEYWKSGSPLGNLFTRAASSTSGRAKSKFLCAAFGL